MLTWKSALCRASVSGSLAALLSGITLALCGKVENDAPAGALNGPSQWIWGQHSAYRRSASWRTVASYSIHHVVSIGWAAVHEKHVASLTQGKPLAVRLIGAGITSAIACGVDYGVAKGRMQPGFDKQLTRPSLLLVYSAFALGLALPSRSGGARRRAGIRR